MKVPSLHQRFESRFRSISYQERRGETYSTVDLSYLPDVPDLESLNFDYDLQVTDQHLAFVGELRRLKDFTVESPLITNDGARHLAELAQMEQLCLKKTMIDDDGLRILGGMPRLKRLMLHGSSAVTGKALSHLPRECRLEDLWLQGTRFDNGLDYMNVSSLTRLIAMETPLTDSGLEPLQQAVNLENLWIDDTQVTDAGLLHIARLPNLKLMLLRGTKITDAGLEHLSGLKLLEGLVVSETAVTEAGAQRLVEQIPTLQVAIGPNRSEMQWVRGGDVPE